MNEEGSRFSPGMMGSEAFAGERGIEAIRTAAQDASGISVGDALDQVARRLSAPARQAARISGRRLSRIAYRAGADPGSRGQVDWHRHRHSGQEQFEITVEGAEGHAGTLARKQRRDALAAFARMAVALDAEIGAMNDDIKFTIGRVTVEPNAPSVVPARVTFSVDLRHPDNAVLDAAGAGITAICKEKAPPCLVAVKPLVDAPSKFFRCASAGADRPRRLRAGLASHADPFSGRPRCAPSGKALSIRNDFHSLPGRRQPCRARLGRARPCRGGSVRAGRRAAHAGIQ